MNDQKRNAHPVHHQYRTFMIAWLLVLGLLSAGCQEHVESRQRLLDIDEILTPGEQQALGSGTRRNRDQGRGLFDDSEDLSARERDAIRKFLDTLDPGLAGFVAALYHGHMGDFVGGNSSARGFKLPFAFLGRNVEDLGGLPKPDVTGGGEALANFEREDSFDNVSIRAYAPTPRYRALLNEGRQVTLDNGVRFIPAETRPTPATNNKSDEAPLIAFVQRFDAPPFGERIVQLSLAFHVGGLPGFVPTVPGDFWTGATYIMALQFDPSPQGGNMHGDLYLAEGAALKPVPSTLSFVLSADEKTVTFIAPTDLLSTVEAI